MQNQTLPFLLLAQFRAHMWRLLKKPTVEHVEAEIIEILGARRCSGKLQCLSQAFWVPMLRLAGPRFAEVLSSVRGARERELFSRKQSCLTSSVFQALLVHGLTHSALAWAAFSNL